MVSPPPGVSSAVSVPPIASARPRARARPSPTPVCVVPVAEPLEGLEDPLPVGRRDAGPAVDDPDLDPAGVRAGGDQHGGSPGGLYRTALASRLARTRSSSARVGEHLGQVSGGDADCRAARPARGRRGTRGTISSSADRLRR